jgi:hypothetical protein
MTTFAVVCAAKVAAAALSLNFLALFLSYTHVPLCTFVHARSEALSAKFFDQEYGYLASHDDPSTSSKNYAIALAKCELL